MKLNQEISYKELCKELGEKEIQGGKNRSNQISRLQKKYEIDKIGRGKYIIKRQLTAQEIQDAEDEKNYSKYLQNMLLKYFANNEVSHTYSYRELREHLAMVNQHYFPVKYGQEQVELSMPMAVNINDGFCDSELDYGVLDEERKWFNIAEAHDKDALRYAIGQLEKAGLISSCTKTYIFFKHSKIDKDTSIIEKKIATPEQVAKLDQIKLDFVKEKGLPSTRSLYSLGADDMREYNSRVIHYLRGLGFERYTRAFTIVRPTELKKVVSYFAPKFNKMQVQRYLVSKRFKAIEPYIHEQLTEQLIKQ